MPIMGCFFGTDTIAINSKVMLPPQIRLFIALHESKHADQHLEGRFEAGYFNTVVNGDKVEFLRAYTDLEREANDYAIESMRQLGFSDFINMEERRLRGNELAGSIVYDMMREDIQKFDAQNFTDLLIAQVV